MAADKTIHICLVDDSDDDAASLADALERAQSPVPIQTNHVKSKKAVSNALEEEQCDVVVGVPGIKRFDAYKALEALEECGADVPVIGVRKDSDNGSVVEAMRNGLVDLVDFDNLEHLLLVVERTLKSRPGPNDFAHHDFTGLYSRVHFLNLLEESLEKEDPKDQPRMLLYVQLDSFGWINESFGIVTGDLFLKSLAGVISDALEPRDAPARYHGGTFVILLRGERINELEDRAKELGAAIASHVYSREQEVISSTASIGMALVTEVTEESDSLIAHAFDACEEAKADGGNAVYWYGTDAAQSGREKDQEAWIARIRHAFENDMFTLLFQPIISLRGDQTPRYEVLVRMLNEAGETIAPGAFLPFAERAGLMTDVDRWVITHSIFAAKRQVKLGAGPEMFLKLSGKTLIDKNMPAWISHAFKENTCPTELVVFEITESLAHLHLAQTRTLISQFKQLGCKVCLDHFGTNVGSLKSLDQLEVDYLKIDGSLIRGLSNSEHHQSQVKKIINKARDMDIGIIAESIQTASSLPLLWQYGVEYIQGYFLQQPSPEMNYDFSETVF